MKILPNLVQKIKFTSDYKFDNLEENNKVKCFSIDDGRYYSEDARVRDALRAHMYSQIFPSYSNEAEKSSSYASSLDDVYIPNLQKIAADCYRGASISKYSEYMPLLKKSGVHSVIDLAGNNSIENDCEKYGLSYFGYNVDAAYWSNPIFRKDEDLINERKAKLSKHGFSKREFDSALDEYKITINLERRKFMRDFFDLIGKINERSFYICCDYGEYRTPNILALNTFFNPRWNGLKTYPTNDFIYDKIKIMYENLSADDKARLGFTKEFEGKLRLSLGVDDEVSKCS